ncbi:MAG: alpha/beta fold hydrolase [Oryzihumus sp.]
MISTAGLTVHELGDAEAAGTLVLLHGLTDSGLCWPDAVRRWGPSYRLFAVDFRGHGTSPRFTHAQLAADPGDLLLADTVGLLEGRRGPDRVTGDARGTFDGRRAGRRCRRAAP